MRIICLAFIDDSHEMSSPIYSEKIKKIKMTSAEVVMCSLRVKVIITPEV